MAVYVAKRDAMELRVHENVDVLSTNLADYISELSEASIKERGAFTLALSGASIVTLMGKLCESPYKRTVDWAKWYVFFADERAIAKNHADSTCKQLRDTLLAKVPIDHSHVYSINDSVPVEQAAKDYEFVIRQLVKTRVISASEIHDCPKFDLVLLEMGPDGNVASLFPNHSALDLEEEWVTYITDSPEPPPERITFTLPVINSASNVTVVVTGVNNAEAARMAIDHESAGVPARMVSPVKGKLVWFLETAAASKLQSVQFSE
ncbi:putative 6-phosphogluconolactonase 1 [Dorcoceras hygrometricum]|uniref:Probable 6-phosphogluconolactonase n=1 Tax=Dorcoceras hygrometricum TaxID=472368 RepID=A0A2Z7AKT2_9LAMI|nr:putative 6-phosphogluconolactonase 1 [Dorcoceras hygrometricum]